MARRRRFAQLTVLSLVTACAGNTPSRNDPWVQNPDPSAGDGSADGSTGDGADGSQSDGDDGTDPGACAIPQGVYYGTTTPTTVMLSPGQIKAIGRFDVGGGLCSGTLVKRDFVLTAKHCTTNTSTSRMVFAVGADPANPDREYRVAAKFEHPQRDSAILQLASSPLDDDPTIVPIRVNDESLEGRLQDIFEGAGYGGTEDGNYGTRYFTAEPLVDLNDELASVDGEGRHGLCGGDSGGPLLGIFPEGPRVVGGLYYGDESCVGVDSYTRTDTIAAWIEGIIGPLADCGDVDAAGRCDGDVATWCEGGATKTDRCADQGMVCGQDPAAGGNRCIPDYSCGTLTEQGSCDGTIAQWCQDGRKQQQNCATSGLVCGADPSGDNRCITDPCADIPADGECRGDTATLCLGHSKVEVDCTRCGQVCSVGASGPSCVDG